MVKKIIISIIISFLIILGIQSNVIAMNHTFYKGETDTVIDIKDFYKGLQIRFDKWAQYNLGKVNDGDLYCIQENQALSENFLTYEIINKVSIKGFQSMGLDGSIVNDVRNEIFAYILNGKNDAINDGESHSGTIDKEGKVTMAIWDFAKEWVTYVGNKHGISSTFADQSQSNTFLANEAKNYSKQIENSKMENLTSKEKIKITTVSVNSINYFKVGPLNWKYGGNLNEVKGYDKNGTEISGIKYAKPNGNSIEEIKMKSIPRDGSDFYILFPSSTSTSKISKITAKTDMKLHCVDIWFLKPVTNPGQQNMIIRSNPHTENQKMEIEIPDIEITGDLKIGKFDEDTGERLDRVEFKVKNSEGKFIAKDLFDVNLDTNIYTLKSGKTISYTTNSNDAQIFNTGTVKKDITIKNIPVGRYTIIETNNPNKNYKFDAISVGVQVNANIINNKDRLINSTYNICASSESLKRYGGSGETIETSKIKDFINRLYLGILNRNGDAGGLDDYTKILADKNSTESIRTIIAAMINSDEFKKKEPNSENDAYKYIERLYTHVLQRGYKAYEIVGHNYMAWYGASGITIKNKRQNVNIKIRKIDSITKKYIENVSFSLRMTSGDKKGLYLSVGSDGNAQYNTNEVQMRTKNTDIVINNAFMGEYEIKEFQNPNPGYETNVNRVIKSGNIEDDVTIELQNDRKYINISGVVWEDIQQGKESRRNNLKDDNDKLLKNITVQLMEKGNNTPIKETKTDENGKYTFTNINIDKLNEYYVQFKYNGMYYANVDKDLNNVNGSKSIEKNTVRTAFNDKFTTIEFGQANGKDGNKSGELKYDTTSNSSTIKYANEKNTSLGYPATNVDDLYYIISNTFDAYNGYLDKIKTAEEIKNKGITEISNINLGLYKRDQPNISLDADIHSARVEINNQSHIYEYSQRMKNRSEYGNAHSMDPQVKFQTNTKYAGLIYERPMYPSDIKAGDEKGLKLYITYKLGIQNLSTSLDAVVGKISYYFDNKYNKVVNYGIKINDNGSINGGKEIKNDHIYNVTNEYSKAILDVNVLVEPQQESFVYIELEVNNGEIYKIVNQTEQVKLDCIAEISSYSIKKNKKTYAGIDTNSQPGNLKIDAIATYEDDTAQAPGLSLILQEERTVTGNVFVDATSGELKTGEIRQGSGAYDNGDIGLEGVKVTLVDENTNVENKEENHLSTTTNENGVFTISGFIPGEYYIEYEWGNKTYKVQDYKSTIVDKNEYEDKQNNKEWYKKYSDDRKSDAVDDFTLRRAIDEQVKEVTNKNKEVVNNYAGKIGNDDLITTMISKTPVFKVNIEKDNDKSTIEDEYQKNDDGTLKIENGKLVKKDEFKNEIKNMDFGIVERARQNVNLDKRIKHVKVTLANGNEIINGTIENGKLENPSPNIVYLPQIGDMPGQVKVEIDNEIVQGAQLEIEYELAVTNTSEIDYTSEEFYKYGSKAENKGEKVTITVNKIIDYLDSSITSEIDEEKWKILSEGEKLELYTNGLVNETVKNNAVDKAGKVITSDKLSSVALKPNDKTQVLSVKAYKLLSNIEQEETLLENHAEILKVTKTGGASLQTTPGNYVPSQGPNEADDDVSERFTIIPPTGNGVDYIVNIVIAISALAVLVVGIILIKRYTINQK